MARGKGAESDIIQEADEGLSFTITSLANIDATIFLHYIFASSLEMHLMLTSNFILPT